MSAAAPPLEGYDDNPEWDEAAFADARPASEVLPAAAVATLVKNKGGRPRGSDKAQISLRIDRDVLERYRSSGDGWMTRMNEALRKADP